MTNRYRRSGGLAAIAAVTAIGLAACSGSNSPHVASLSNSHATGATTTTLPKGNPTQLLDEWASCERSNGDPQQVDPTIDANGVIHITFPASTGPGPQSLGGGDAGGGGPCNAYLTAASTALRGGQPSQKPDPAKLLKFSQCMQKNGIPDFPDPSGGGLQIHTSPGSDLNPNNPTFLAASKLCGKKTGLSAFGTPGSPGRGAIQATSSISNGAGPGAKGVATENGGGATSVGGSGG